MPWGSKQRGPPRRSGALVRPLPCPAHGAPIHTFPRNVTTATNPGCALRATMRPCRAFPPARLVVACAVCRRLRQGAAVEAAAPGAPVASRDPRCHSACRFARGGRQPKARARSRSRARERHPENASREGMAVAPARILSSTPPLRPCRQQARPRSTRRGARSSPRPKHSAWRRWRSTSDPATESTAVAPPSSHCRDRLGQAR